MVHNLWSVYKRSDFYHSNCRVERNSVAFILNKKNIHFISFLGCIIRFWYIVRYDENGDDSETRIKFAIMLQADLLLREWAMYRNKYKYSFDYFLRNSALRITIIKKLSNLKNCRIFVESVLGAKHSNIYFYIGT